MSIEEKQKQIIEEFEGLEWIDRYEMIIEYGKDLKPFPAELRTQQNLIEGCQSEVWFTAELQDGKVIYRADSDALLVKGIVALLVDVLSGHTPKEIVDADLHFIDDIQLREHLSPTRSNGVAAMLHQMRLFALALSAN